MLEIGAQVKGIADMKKLSPEDIDLIDYMMAVNNEEILDAIGEGFAEVKDILAALTVRFNTLPNNFRCSILNFHC